jgi:hypothetical protein
LPEYSVPADAEQLDFSKLTFSVAFAALTITLVGSLPAVRLNNAGEFQFERLAEANVFLRPSYLDDGWFISDVRLAICGWAQRFLSAGTSVVV